MWTIHPAQNPGWALCRSWKGAFTKEECESIQQHFQELEDAVVQVREADAFTSVKKDEFRRTRVGWLKWNQSVDWIFQRLYTIVKSVNDQHYHFDLTGFLEPIQLSEYDVGGVYQWHMDAGAAALSIRKLSFVVMLTPPEEYDGGELELMPGIEPVFGDRAQGTMVCFPAYGVHRVLPVTRGRRRTLVGWVSGPPYR